MRIEEFTIPDDAPDVRAGDVVIADPDGAGWRVLIVQDVVALALLVPFGDRGTRRFVAEGNLVDSRRPRWEGAVHLMVTMSTERFESVAAAADALDAGRLASPIGGVCVAASSLAGDRAVLHRAAD